MSRQSFYQNLGPPDPIDYLRDASRHIPAEDEGFDMTDIVEEGQEDQAKPLPRKEHHHHKQDPPARERPEGDIWPYRDTLSFTRSLVFYGAGAITDESERACAHIQQSRELRQKYFGAKGCKVRSELLEDASANLTFTIGANGVAELYHPDHPFQNLVEVHTIDEFSKDYTRLVEMVSDGATRSFSFQRLQLLSTSLYVSWIMHHASPLCFLSLFYHSHSSVSLLVYMSIVDTARCTTR
jgi:hypothetical protein